MLSTVAEAEDVVGEALPRAHRALEDGERHESPARVPRAGDDEAGDR